MYRSGLLSCLIGALSCDASDSEGPAAGASSLHEPEATPTARSLLEPRRLGEALKALVDPLGGRIRILTVKALHRQVILQVQAQGNPSRVDEYRFKDGEVSGPVEVTLLGAGKLQDNLFPLQAANPQVGCQVLRNVEEEYGSQNMAVRKMVMIRNLPQSRDIQFRVFLDAPKGVFVVKADKTGRLLGDPEPAPESYQ